MTGEKISSIQNLKIEIRSLNWLTFTLKSVWFTHSGHKLPSRKLRLITPESRFIAIYLYSHNLPIIIFDLQFQTIEDQYDFIICYISYINLIFIHLKNTKKYFQNNSGEIISLSHIFFSRQYQYTIDLNNKS